MSNKWIVKKVLDVKLNYDSASEWCDSITFNYLEECPECKTKNAELEEFRDLDYQYTPSDPDKGFYRQESITCSNCKSIFRLIDECYGWYASSIKVVLITPFYKSSQ